MAAQEKFHEIQRRAREEKRERGLFSEVVGRGSQLC